MKTTIDFPDDLLQRAKLVAVQRKITLKDIVLQGVDFVLSHAIDAPSSETGQDPSAKAQLSALSQGRNTESVGAVNRDLIYRRSADHEAKERQAHMMRLLEAMKASNTEPMVPLKREEIYER